VKSHSRDQLLLIQSIMSSLKSFMYRYKTVHFLSSDLTVTGHFGPWILQTHDISIFDSILVGLNCPESSALVPKCLKDRSDLSAKLSSSKCRSVQPHVCRLRYIALTTEIVSIDSKSCLKPALSCTYWQHLQMIR